MKLEQFEVTSTVDRAESAEAEAKESDFGGPQEVSTNSYIKHDALCVFLCGLDGNVRN